MVRLSNGIRMRTTEEVPMTPHEANEFQPPVGDAGHRRLLPLVGGGVVGAAVLAHFLGGGLLMHVGLPALLVYLGFGGGALLVALAAIVAIKLLMIVGATKLVGRTRFSGPMAATGAALTTGKTLHAAHSYDRHVALLTLGRGRARLERTIDLARIASGEHVLDVGCGTGEVTMRAKARTGSSGSVAGIDPSPEMIAVARQKAAQAELDVDYRVAAVEALPFPDATFDVVLSSLMMHHLPADLKPRGLAEIGRVLKPGGRLVVIDFKKPTSLLGRLAPVWLLHRSSAAHSLQDLVALLDEAGFTAIETGNAGVSYLGCVHARAGR